MHHTLSKTEHYFGELLKSLQRDEVKTAFCKSVEGINVTELLSMDAFCPSDAVPKEVLSVPECVPANMEPQVDPDVVCEHALSQLKLRSALCLSPC